MTALEDPTEPVKLPTFEVPVWEYEGLVKDMLYHYAEQGDVQMCVTVLLTLKDIGRQMIDLDVQVIDLHTPFLLYKNISYKNHQSHVLR